MRTRRSGIPPISMLMRAVKELTVRDGVDAEASAGRDILAVSDFTVEETADGTVPHLL